jgi:hypothetical protein
MHQLKLASYPNKGLELQRSVEKRRKFTRTRKPEHKQKEQVTTDDANYLQLTISKPSITQSV